MKIAVIGTGIAGNVVSYHLNREHDITVYEANDYIGGHTHTHDVHSAGTDYRIDTGFIVFNRQTYPHFIRLLDELGVESQATEMSFSVKSEKNGLEYNGSNLDTLFAQRRNLINLSFYKMLFDIRRFNRDALHFMSAQNEAMELGEFLHRGKYSQEFIDHYILPMGAAIWSSDCLQMLKFPAQFFIRFFHHHGLLSVTDRPQWYVIKNGSREYVKRLVKGFESRIRLSSPVFKVRRRASSVEITCRGQQTEKYDALFIATHSDQALKMLSDASPEEQQVLGAIEYQKNEAVLHTDSSLLPNNRKAWAAWNYHLPEKQGDRVAVTYSMNILQGIKSDQQFCVTLNNDRDINKDKILRRITYEHPVFNSGTLEAQARHREINGVNRTFYCGAYWRNGFHEDGVVSALDALSHFNKFTDYEQLNIRRAS